MRYSTRSIPTNVMRRLSLTCLSSVLLFGALRLLLMCQVYHPMPLSITYVRSWQSRCRHSPCQTTTWYSTWRSAWSSRACGWLPANWYRGIRSLVCSESPVKEVWIPDGCSPCNKIHQRLLLFSRADIEFVACKSCQFGG